MIYKNIYIQIFWMEMWLRNYILKYKSTIQFKEYEKIITRFCNWMSNIDFHSVIFRSWNYPKTFYTNTNIYLLPIFSILFQLIKIPRQIVLSLLWLIKTRLPARFSLCLNIPIHYMTFFKYLIRIYVCFKIDWITKISENTD